MLTNTCNPIITSRLKGQLFIANSTSPRGVCLLIVATMSLIPLKWTHNYAIFNKDGRMRESKVAVVDSEQRDIQRQMSIEPLL